jgi:hypothetical protein
MRRMMLVLMVVAAQWAVAGSARADVAQNPSNANALFVSLQCNDGSTFTGVTIAQNSAKPFQVVGTTAVAVQFEGSFVDVTDPDLTPVVYLVTPGIAQQQALVTCTFEEPELFPNLVITGEFMFTPSR